MQLLDRRIVVDQHRMDHRQRRGAQAFGALQPLTKDIEQTASRVLFDPPAGSSTNLCSNHTPYPASPPTCRTRQDLRPGRKRTLDVCRGYMVFDDAGMATGQPLWHTVAFADTDGVVGLGHVNRETGGLQMLYPGGTTAAARFFVALHTGAGGPRGVPAPQG